MFLRRYNTKGFYIRKSQIMSTFVNIFQFLPSVPPSFFLQRNFFEPDYVSNNILYIEQSHVSFDLRTKKNVLRIIFLRQQTKHIINWKSKFKKKISFRFEWCIIQHTNGPRSTWNIQYRLKSWKIAGYCHFFSKRNRTSCMYFKNKKILIDCYPTVYLVFYGIDYLLTH